MNKAQMFEHPEHNLVWKNRYNGIINDAYKNYANSHTTFKDGFALVTPMAHSKESFIEAIKTDNEFAKKWGVKISERKLSLRERYELVRVNGLCPKYSFEIEDGKPIPNKLNESEWYDNYNIPTKKCRLKYKNEIVEYYE